MNETTTHDTPATYAKWYILKRAVPAFVFSITLLIALSVLRAESTGPQTFTFAVGAVCGALMWEALIYKPGVVNRDD